MTILYDLEISLEKLAIVNFQELDYRPTPMGLLTLRRRKEITLGIDIYEIKLDEEFLMSSLFTVAEVALANLGLAELSEPELDVVVGGLGLGYTAKTVLEHPEVRELLVVDTLREVIEWHRQGLLPLSEQLTSDHRCRFVHGDFFAMSASRFRGVRPRESRPEISRHPAGRGPLPSPCFAPEPQAFLPIQRLTPAYIAPSARRSFCPLVQ